MRIRKQQSGFAAVELVVVVVIVAAIVAIGLWVYNQHKVTTTAGTNPTNTSRAQSPVAKDVSTTPPINSTSDLDSALNTLNQNDPSSANAADSSQLSSQTNF